MSPLYEESPGDSPLIINVPHAGTRVLPTMHGQLTHAALALPDTDWHVEKLIAFAAPLGITTLAATHSRYVIDLNRDPTGLALYPGASNTELCPLTTFDDQPIYASGAALSATEVENRRAGWWAPYHAELQRLIAQTKARHGYAIVLDLHSIRSRVPRFFAGPLPDLNLGTASGTSCAREIESAAYEVLSASGLTHVLNGRFKGGYITRRYGEPAQAVHALQLETAQCCYMDESPPYPWNLQRAHGLIEVLKQLADALLAVELPR